MQTRVHERIEQRVKQIGRLERKANRAAELSLQATGLTQEALSRSAERLEEQVAFLRKRNNVDQAVLDGGQKMMV